MIFNEVSINQFYQIAKKLKKVSHCQIQIKDLANWCHTINLINGLSADMANLDGFPLEKYNVPEFLSDLIMPTRLVMVDSVIYEDFKSSKYKEADCAEFTYKHGKDGDKIDSFRVQRLDPTDFNMVSHSIMSNRNKGDGALRDVDSLRIVQTLPNVINRLTNGEGDKVQEGLDLFIPILCSVTFKKDKVYTKSVEDMFKEWFFHNYSRF